MGYYKFYIYWSFSYWWKQAKEMKKIGPVKSRTSIQQIKFLQLKNIQRFILKNIEYLYLMKICKHNCSYQHHKQETSNATVFPFKRWSKWHPWICQLEEKDEISEALLFIRWWPQEMAHAAFWQGEDVSYKTYSAANRLFWFSIAWTSLKV